MPSPDLRSASAVTLSEIPSAEPLQVARAFTIEIAPCTVARTLFFITRVHRKDRRELFSLHPAAQLSLSRFRTLSTLVPKASHIHRLLSLLHFLPVQLNLLPLVSTQCRKQCCFYLYAHNPKYFA